VPAAATAYPGRDAEFVMNVHARWSDAAKDDTCTEWARELFDAMAPHAMGTAYLNFMPADEEGRLPAALGASYERLVALKDRYDPKNLFRLNQNIAPSGS